MLTLFQRVLARTQLRAAAVSMAGVLASYVCALGIERYLRQHVDLLILSVALASTLAWRERGRPPTIWWLPAAVLTPAAAAAAAVGEAMARDKLWAEAILSIVLGGSVWVRRFGGLAADGAALGSLPFVATLVTPFAPQQDLVRAAWWTAIAAIVTVWVGTVAWAASRTGFLRRNSADIRRARRTAGSAATSGRFSATTRMAAQMSLSLGVAFVVGRHLDAVHWAWPVLTAFIVCSGNRGRADVVYKGILRAAGAALGTVAATGISGQFAAGDKRLVVAIFMVLAVATLLRPVSYAFWAAGITAALALLYGYFGEGGQTLLAHRLEGILWGAAVAVAVSWFVVPVRPTDVLRWRVAGLLTAVMEVLDPCDSARDSTVTVQIAAAHVRALGDLAPALRLARRIGGRWRALRWPADIIDATAPCAEAVARVVALSRQRPGVLVNGSSASTACLTVANVGRLRRSLVSRNALAAGRLAPLDRGTSPTAPDADLEAALVVVNDIVCHIWDSASGARGWCRPPAGRHRGPAGNTVGVPHRPRARGSRAAHRAVSSRTVARRFTTRRRLPIAATAARYPDDIGRSRSVGVDSGGPAHINAPS